MGEFCSSNNKSRTWTEINQEILDTANKEIKRDRGGWLAWLATAHVWRPTRRPLVGQPHTEAALLTGRRSYVSQELRGTLEASCMLQDTGP